MNSGLKVIAPATVSNLACGFDVLGMAIDVPGDEIIGRWSDQKGITIQLQGADKNIPADPDKNTAGISAQAVLKHLGDEGRGLEMKIRKHIPAGSGLGSSASSAVAAAFLVNAMLGRPLEKKELISFAMQGELGSGSRCGDNVVASMMGGLMLVRDVEALDIHRIYTPPGLFMAILLPDLFIPTKLSRDIMKSTIDVGTMVKQTADLGSFIIGMERGDFDLIRRSMEDHVIEPLRKQAIPFFDDVKNIALDSGALGCSISGSGPAIFALCQERTQATEIAGAMQKIYDRNNLTARSFSGGINQEGVQVQ